MSSLTFESSSLENYTTIGLKILTAMFELKLAKPHGYSKKKFTQLQDDKALYLFNK